ncbi:protein dopey-1 homolog isoform X1 [Cimex lectularius]|uniref:Dopey n=1 Tax=Cimex lectularius TaxID=79782 RepID=A0A8I6RPQ8_CIMLE|nr:protein dopey-1 homolog isoform X1 [Cimex lectularius]
MGPIVLEEYELMRDSKYRLYTNAIDKALKNFEYSTEWADLISALGKLNKVIVSHTKFPVIPRRIKISKRLAQCMHPTLPFGVHLKALETYDVIFKSMGTQRLSHELFIYSAGLFPLFGDAAMKVRPDLLRIYETHFVPLGHRFRPALPGFLSGVLPGFDKNSDHFIRTNELLENVCEGVGSTFFYGCLWECLTSNSYIRLPSIIFLLSHFDKKLPTEDQAHIMGNNIETMLCGLMACIEDSNILVQRNALDLLMLGFPMHNSHLTTDDMIRLVTKALFTILRRDISLKRRLYGWLLGSEVNMTILSHHPSMRKAKAEGRSTSYFDVFSKDMLVKAVKIILDNSIGILPFDLRPFNLLISMLDKDKKEENIGQAILGDVLFEYFRLLYLCCHTETKNEKVELLQCVNTLFGILESKYLWQYMGQLLERACQNPVHCSGSENPVKRVASGEPGVVEICTLTEYLLDTISLEAYADTPSEHLPSLFLQIVTLLTKHYNSLSAIQVANGLKLCAKILTRVQPVIIGHHNISMGDMTDTDPTDSSIMNSIQESSSSDFNQNTDSSSIDEKMDLPKDDEQVGERDSLLEQCLRQYEDFYVTFICGTRAKVGETNDINYLLQKLKVKSSKPDEKTKQLDSVLTTVLKEKSDKNRNDLPDNEWVEPMKLASQLLVDLSTLQTFFQSANSQRVVEIDLYKKEGAESIELLPEWLKALITCTCWLNYTTPLQIIAIKTLLNLVSLCTTAQSLVSKTVSEDCATPLLIVPLLTPNHLKFMEKNTFIFQVITHWLWAQLNINEYRVKSVELLHQLHSVFPHNSTVELCISHYLKPTPGVNVLESFRRFTSLWHIGREVNIKQRHSLRVSDIFYSSMLKMLDNLKLPNRDCLRIEAEEWLMHSLLHGDIHRIMDPLLYILLDSSTARLSVLHIKINNDSEPILKDGTTGDGAVNSVDGSLVQNKEKKISIKVKNEKQLPVIVTSPVTDKTDKKESDDNTQNDMPEENLVINTDFDEYFEESEASKNAEDDETSATSDKVQSERAVIRNYSFPNFGINNALKLSSLDLLNLSDTLFTKVSEGECLSSRLNRSSFSSEGIANIVTIDSNTLVRSWSFPGKEIETDDLEESTPAEDYFSKGGHSLSIVEEVMAEIIDQVVMLSEDVNIKPALRPKPKLHRKLQYQSTITSHTTKIDHSYAHILLYKNKYNHKKVLYIFETLRNILICNPRAFICTTASTGLVSRSPILKLLARHRKSLFGRGFSGDLEGNSIKNAMYLEVVILICLYFLRSYYPNLESIDITKEDIIGNKEVQMTCTEILTQLTTQLILIIREGTDGLSKYIGELFIRTKFYKIVLHTAYTSLQCTSYNTSQFSQQILNFNDSYDATQERLSRHAEALQKNQVRLLLAIIILEYEVAQQRGENQSKSSDKQGDLNDCKYINGKSIPQQPLFLTIITHALDITTHRHTHANWIGLLACALPYLGPALTKVVATSLKQICHNIEVLSENYVKPGTSSFPPDYGLIQIEALTVLCHFCLLDTSNSIKYYSTSVTQPPTQYPSNFIYFFGNSSANLEPKKEKNEAQVAARKTVLGLLPQVIASVSVLWHALMNIKERDEENSEVGSPRVIKQQIIEFLSPIAVHHATSFLAAMAIVWREQRKPTASPVVTATSNISEDQHVLVQLLIGIKAMPIDIITQTLHQVVRQPAMNQEIAVSVEVSALELFVNYAQYITVASLFESWSSLLQLLREAPALSPPAQFLLLGALSQFIQRCPAFTDKKDQKDLQDITIKLVESCNTIAGACLLNTNWFIRKNLTVREEEPVITPDKEDKYVDDAELTEYDCVTLDELTDGKPKKKSKLKRVTQKIRQDAEKLQISAMNQWFMKTFVNETPLDFSEKKSGSNSVAQYSIGALTILSQLLGPLLDVAFGSQEKDRVVSLLTTLMYNVTPYLKNHTQRNASSYYACSELLSSITSYQYTRKAWKKEVTDLLFDSSFFQMEIRSLKCWCTIIDNLMSQEESTFREFMSRVSVPQSNSLNIFSSKEQEFEQRAQLLKRLAFVLYCGENDQFHNNMSDIQERLADCVKTPQLAPNLHAQVFLCFRVLLLRMSPSVIMPLWPIIISEILQVMIILEQHLSTDYEEFSSSVRALSSMELNWMANGAQLTGSWLQLHLAVVNLLFLAEQLPADRLTQFQMYRWAFIGEESGTNSNSNENPDFVPHISRIANLMDLKYGMLEAVPTPLIPTCSQIKTLQDLHPFFTAMRNGKYTPLTVSQLEHNLELDFLDVMAPR